MSATATVENGAATGDAALANTPEPVAQPLVAKPPVGGKAFEIRSEDDGPLAGYLDRTKFEQAYSCAKMFADSDMVPAHFKGKVGNCFIAFQLAIRLRMDPFMVMQNTYVVHGRPGFEGKFVIALVNSSGLFRDPLEFAFSGEGEKREVRAFAFRASTGKECSLTFKLKTAVDEGWVKGNQKWRTMEDQMMIYRSAAFFARAYCPERLMGAQTIEELHDVKQIESFDVTRVGVERSTTQQTASAIVDELAKGKNPTLRTLDESKVSTGGAPADSGQTSDKPTTAASENPTPSTSPAGPVKSSAPSAHEELVILLAERCDCTNKEATERLQEYAQSMLQRPYQKVTAGELSNIRRQITSGTIVVEKSKPAGA